MSVDDVAISIDTDEFSFNQATLEANTKYALRRYEYKYARDNEDQLYISHGDIANLEEI